MNIEILKKILKDKKISYAKLSDLSGISINTIKSVLCGKTKNPTIDTINSIKQALRLDIDDFDYGIAQNYITQDEEKILKIFRDLDEKSKKYFITFAEGLKAQNENN